MATPMWFDYKAYFNNKLASLNGYNDLTLKAAFEGAGYSVDADGLFKHFQDHGNSEGISPVSYFDSGYYFQSKAAQFYGKDISTVTNADVSFIQAAFANAGLSAWDHYFQYGMAEGIDPNSNFDSSAYMDAKLALMQKEDPSYTMDQLVKAFKDADLNPVTHYLLHGKGEGLTVQDAQHGGVSQALTTGVDNLKGTTGTPTVDANGNLTINTNYNDYFTAETGTLQSADTVDGLGGVDTLYARVNTSEAPTVGDAIEPTISNVEYVLFQAQVAAGPGGGVPVAAFIDAGRISLADGQNLTLGSVNSRADLSIEDVSHNSHETTIRFADTDPAVNFDVFFDPQNLTSAAGNTSGTLNLQLMDVKNAQLSNDPLKENPFDKFTFEHDNGTATAGTVTLTFRADDKALYSGADATYATLLTAFQNALADYEAANPTMAGIFSVALGAGFTGTTMVGGTTYTSNVGQNVVITSNNGAINASSPTTGWGVSTGTVPAVGGIVWGADQGATTTCPLIATTVELDNVGRVQWDDASPNCLPDDVIYGSGAGDLEIGSMALRGGVERFDVKVDEGSWLSSLFSTNQTLRMVTVEAKDIDGDGKSGGQLYIGDWAGRGDQLGNGNQATWTDAAKLLAVNAAAGAEAGLNDVAVFDATGYAGDINIAAQITATSFDKYLKSVDGVKYIDQMFAPNAGYEGQFSYLTGNGKDVVNMTVNGAIAADVDFKMTIDTGAGDDLVAFRYANMTANQSLNQKNLENVNIKTGEGNDTVWFYGNVPGGAGSGSVVINTGAGNDVIYANQNDFIGAMVPGTPVAPANYNAVFVFNTNDRSVNINGLAGATLGNDMAIGNNSFAVTAATGTSVWVTVEFKGYTAQVKIADVVTAGTSFSAEQINHAIINAIAGDSNLSNLLVAKDGAGHTLLIESLINGQMTLNDLNISFQTQAANGTFTAGGVTTGAWYNTQFGAQAGVNYTGNNSTDSQVVVDAGAGDDLIVLGPNFLDAARAIALRDVVELNGASGNDTLIGFQSGTDKINVAGLGLNANGVLNNNAANALTQNTAVIAAANAAATTGIFTQTEVNALVANNTLAFAGAAATGATAVVLLQDVNAAGENVYTVVALTKGATTTATVMGSMTLDLVNGVPQALANGDFALNSVLQDAVVGTTFGAAQYHAVPAGTTVDGTILADTFNDLNTADLVNAAGAAINTVNGGLGDDTFNVNRSIAAATALNGDEGNDTFTVTDALEAITANWTFNGGAGTDALSINASADKGVAVSVSGIENIAVTHGATKAQAVAVTVTGATDGLTITGTDATADTLTINAAAADVTINGVDMANLNAFTYTASKALTIKSFDDNGASATYTFAAATGEVYFNGAASTGVLTLTGSAQDDTFIGGAGADVFTGGVGNDTLTGGAGADTFNLTNVAAGGIDTITDYAKGVDKVNVGGATAYAGGLKDLLTVDSSSFATLETFLTSLTAAQATADSVCLVKYDGDVYALLNGTTAGYNAAEDAVVKLSGVTTAADVTVTDFTHA